MLYKSVLIGLLLMAGVGSTFAQEANSVAEAKKLAEIKCTQSCVILSPQEVQNIESNIRAAIQQAYEAGLRGWGKQS